jgi:hypothetical protein
MVFSALCSCAQKHSSFNFLFEKEKKKEKLTKVNQYTIQMLATRGSRHPSSWFIA